MLSLLDPPTPVNETAGSGPGSSGSTFTWRPGRWQYDWSTRGVAAGYVYQIGVRLDDGVDVGADGARGAQHLGVEALVGDGLHGLQLLDLLRPEEADPVDLRHQVVDGRQVAGEPFGQQADRPGVGAEALVLEDRDGIRDGHVGTVALGPDASAGTLLLSQIATAFNGSSAGGSRNAGGAGAGLLRRRARAGSTPCSTMRGSPSSPPTIPTSTSLWNRRAAPPSRVNTAVPLAYRFALMRARPSSKLSTRTTPSTGPKISSR